MTCVCMLLPQIGVEYSISPVTSPALIWTLDLQLLNLAIQLLIRSVLQVFLVFSTLFTLFGAGFAVESIATH